MTRVIPITKRASPGTIVFILLSFFLLHCNNDQKQSYKEPDKGLANETEKKANSFSFTLKDLHGTERTIADFNSRLIIIDFWATWCAPCQRTIPDLVKIYQEHSENVTIVGISLDEPENLNYVFLTWIICSAEVTGLTTCSPDADILFIISFSSFLVG